MPTLSDLLSMGKRYVQDAMPGGLLNPEVSPQTAMTIGGLLADFTPVVGDVKSAYDGIQSARQGDYLGAALGGLGALPLMPNLAGMFIGKGAKTWDAVNASRAMDMEKAGIDPRKIWSETGNWKGPDGHWRQEIPDNKSFYRGSKAAGGSKSGDLYLNQPLYDAYPGMANYRIQEFDGIGGSTDGRMNMTVGIGGKGTSTAAHEMQHNIQNVEGWASGGSPTAELSMAANSARRRKIQGKPLRESDLPFANVDSRTAADANELYRRLAGEVESRATEARMMMDSAQRRATFPADSYDVPLGDLIIRK